MLQVRRGRLYDTISLWDHSVKALGLHSGPMALRREDDGEGGADLVRKAVYLHRDEAETLRLQAFKERRSESALVREALRRFLKMPD